MPQKSDELFGLVALDHDMPLIVGVLFVLGLVSAAYSAAGSALTSLTTSFTVDILDAHKKKDANALTRVRKTVHVAMSALMGLVVLEEARSRQAGAGGVHCGAVSVVAHTVCAQLSLGL